MKLNGRSALVTGATGGIGRAIARELAGRGSALTVTGRREPALHKLVDELGPPACALTADLSRLDEADDLMDRAGEVDILVANAGVGIPQDLTMLSDSEIEEAVRVNLLAPTALARAAAISMKRRGRGHIVFISSGAGLIATPGNGAVYTATKWGLRGLGLALRQELHGTGVGVSTIFPGPIRDAGMLADTGVTLPRAFGTSSPEDVARAVAGAIERGTPETTVASAGVRLLAGIGSVAPVLIGDLARLAGVGRVRDAMLGRR
ncbi:SDR family NAD(P)-dependent oxidoreductase [Mycolicibacterium nivoides]|uniref:SDR family NAD(P)-dependent oxidoreductase n=1 Tax=Mycolicibacterium nivoides TaxID=2487344 RepID=A0ABW9L970_9MYCO|nr:SDR family NAD(P)-dependent oxidoreductase [Mycolicibacterium boenickei]SEP71301.1 Short-chain dehydrogenase [Mycobacterium sp. 88mf]SFF11986.1 Short-chain dehydrogenase [Mycobacterium sp. 455mf]